VVATTKILRKQGQLSCFTKEASAGARKKTHKRAGCLHVFSEQMTVPLSFGDRRWVKTRKARGFLGLY